MLEKQELKLTDDFTLKVGQKYDYEKFEDIMFGNHKTNFNVISPGKLMSYDPCETRLHIYIDSEGTIESLRVGTEFSID